MCRGHVLARADQTHFVCTLSGACCGVVLCVFTTLVLCTAATLPVKMVHAYYMDDSDADQRLPHALEPSEPVSLEYLADKLGVLYWHMPAAADKCVAATLLRAV